MLTITFILSISTLYAQTYDTKNPDLVNKRQNAIYLAHDIFLTISINYERLFPLNEKNSLGLRSGLGRDGGNKDNVAIVEAIYLRGQSKNFLEFGVAYQQPNLFEKDSEDIPALAIIAGYRYQAPKGFLFKGYLEFLPDLWPAEGSWGHLPFIGFAFGYSF